jgi:hypothetical protein
MLVLNKIQNIRCVEFTERTMMKEEVNLVDSHLEKTISHTPSKSMIASKIKRNVVFGSLLLPLYPTVTNN